MTFSIVAVAIAPDGAREVGGAVATRRPAVGARIPVIRPGVGAAASQAITNPWLGYAMLDLVGRGVPPDVALPTVLAMDPSPELRQLHIVTVDGLTAAHTGASTPDWHGQATAEGVSAAANHCVGPSVVADMLSAFQATGGDLAERLLAALAAGEAAGGDARGKQSAALAVYRAEPFPHVDLRVDDGAEPVQELGRLLALYREERLQRNRPLDQFFRTA
jgi:uncharacterized Ntn-hydrolase superfamily protein